ncbi:tuftelin 1b isoform X2 [Hoplias malabaricus]
MLTDEVSQIQEVRYCLKTLREQMAARNNNNNNKFPGNGINISVPISELPVSNTNVDVSVSENQAENRVCQQCFHGQREHMQSTKKELERQGQQIEVLQRLLGDLELENTTLRDKMATGEAELQELRTLKNVEKENEKLVKQLAMQNEKIHHLHDMLNSHQRKVRHMIEQLQNSRTMIAERDRVIGDLEEKVAFLEAENETRNSLAEIIDVIQVSKNREMRDQVEFCLGSQTTSSCKSEPGPQIVYSKPLTPTSPGNKSLPFIKVIEIKS